MGYVRGFIRCYIWITKPHPAKAENWMGPAMELVPVNAMKSPRRLREQLTRKHELLVTNNGRPMALLLELNPDEDPEVPLRAYREVRSRLALEAIRRAATEAGTDRMSIEDIDAVIASDRAERNQSRA